MTALVDDTDMEARSPASAIAGYVRRSISISHILELIWRGRALVVVGLVLGFAMGVYVVWTTPPKYAATMVVSPSESDLAGGGGSSNAAGSFLADLTGTGNANSVPKFTQFTLGLYAVNTAQYLDSHFDMLCRVNQPDCDTATHHWRERTGIREWVDGTLAWLGHLPDPNGARKVIDLSGYVHGQVNLLKDNKSAVATLTYVNSKPEFAAEFLADVVRSTDEVIKLQNREMHRRYVQYLADSAAKTTNVEQRQAIDSLLLQEERQLMLTEVDVPYAAKIMDGPTVVPVNNVKKILAIYGFLGMTAGIVVAGVWNARASNRQNRK